MRMALIQGTKNVNKAGVRFGWCVNGGFLEGADLVPFARPQLDGRLLAALVNIVPIWKDFERISLL